ncbi:hypothetical protein M3592_20840 [Priestia aryabhattai]|uniref:hypothetical protein n=1 Tax=Priestia TaxID=2800373 RepID=UPI00048CF178|nr:hypothetical protein [Priestia aryabhattai]MCM2977901.1 hypothetical protein [Priestia aryabhattai]MED3988020.1 hypothetical protein [Priestia aryabhattai]MED4022487.1 hypothetical protein [Priestia aryabhattai]
MRRIFPFIIFTIYCIPYVYLSIRKDFEDDSKINYIIMAMVTVVLSYLSGLIRADLSLILGNIVSFSTSYFYNALRLPDPKWEKYFSPVTSVEQIVLISLAALVLQMIVYTVARKRAKRYIRNAMVSK